MEDSVVATEEWIISNNLGDIARINNSEFNMACWERDAPKVSQCINHILNTQLERLNDYCHYTEASKLLKQHLSTVIDTTQIVDCAALLSDVQYLANLFSDISGSKTIRLHFAIVENDMCRRFHTDVNDLRLLCTYYGPGTVLLNNNDISEETLDKAVTQPDIIPKEDIYHINTGDVVVLKGALHHNSTKTGVLHRSPVLSESQQKRIIVRLDTNSFLL